MKKLRLGVLGSGKGSNYLAIQEAIAAGKLAADVVLVVSDREKAGILAHARSFGVPARALPPSRFRTKLEPALESTLVEWLKAAEAEWVVLAGYMRVLKDPMLRAFPNRIVNIHPSLLPAFRGLEAWKQALDAGVAVTGCTIHLVNSEIDAGSILGQREVPVLPGDTSASLHARIQAAEHELYPEILQKIAAQAAIFCKISG